MACVIVPAAVAVVTTVIGKKIPEKFHLNWLNLMLWGGTVMLAVDHFANREIVPYPPFLTAGLAKAFPEMIRVGISMTLIIFLIWGVMVLATVKMSPRISCARK